MTPPTYSSAAKMALAQAQFFKQGKFAVVGASQDPSKFGYKVLKWYLNHDLPVVPINPNGRAIDNIPTLLSLSALPCASSYAISVITPPSVTRGVIAQAEELGIRHVWLQPGAEDAEALATATASGMNVIAGGGVCVLVSGSEAMRAAAKL
ncbi:hypothetical protein PhCBS80983_g04229 [Powellomyces hirtus]|uniref:CoA-binding domain-containing protein n=1 Tax=Powellomyces hirtus TaxID=109895 RepID=A0A507DZ04_9FUNG|nr:hypothetical protein PhCBS80983_g04229 [Powellomyces hirtus]